MWPVASRWEARQPVSGRAVARRPETRGMASGVCAANGAAARGQAWRGEGSEEEMRLDLHPSQLENEETQRRGASLAQPFREG